MVIVHGVFVYCDIMQLYNAQCRVNITYRSSCLLIIKAPYLIDPSKACLLVIIRNYVL
jgi:hypothetical protein